MFTPCRLNKTQQSIFHTVCLMSVCVFRACVSSSPSGSYFSAEPCLRSRELGYLSIPLHIAFWRLPLTSRTVIVLCIICSIPFVWRQFVCYLPASLSSPSSSYFSAEHCLRFRGLGHPSIPIRITFGRLPLASRIFISLVLLLSLLQIDIRCCVMSMMCSLWYVLGPWLAYSVS